MSASEGLRLRQPNPVPANAPQKAQPKKTDYEPVLHDQTRRGRRAPWTPSFSVAVRILLLIRVTGAMYSNFDDCDEIYNFWEPLHLFAHNYGFQTWELSPDFALRSWAYIVLHYLPTRIGAFLTAGDKRTSLYAVRIFLAVITTLVEATFFRAVAEKINVRVGRYVFFMLALSAGMWKASTAFLPSTFAMYTTTLAAAYAIAPSSLNNTRKPMVATLHFATGAIVGWPFALALSLPFVFEELFIFGLDRVNPEGVPKWMATRFKRMLAAVSTAALLFIPVVAIDSLAYGKITVVPWNIVKYNIFGGADRGPDLYGTEPWTYYFNNLVLNFNVLVPLALLALPALAVTWVVDRRRLGFLPHGANESSPFTIVSLRLAPFYLWFAILTKQAHKEERFMFPAYPLLCLNAAICLYLIRGWMEAAYIKVTKSQYQASQTLMFRNATFSVMTAFAVISVARIFAEYHYYHAPASVTFSLQAQELPRLMNVTGLLQLQHDPTVAEDEQPPLDLTPIKEFNLTLCYGKEWHRFTSHWLVPTGVDVQFIKSEFAGLLPAHFGPNTGRDNKFWGLPQTRVAPAGLNDLNREQPAFYVSVETCDYIIDLDFPLHPVSSELEPRFAIDSENWDRVHCEPFLDARHSALPTRVLWFPGQKWQEKNEFGDYCLLRNKHSVVEKERIVAKRVRQE